MDFTHNNLIFRSATASDTPLIIRLLRESARQQDVEGEFFTTEEDLLRDIFGKIPKAHILLVEQNGQTAGLAVFFYNFASFIGSCGIYIEDIYVRPDFQGMGIGKQIFLHLAKHAIEQGCDLLEWLVLDINEQARGFYKRMCGNTSVDGWTVNRLKGKDLQKLVSLI